MESAEHGAEARPSEKFLVNLSASFPCPGALPQLLCLLWRKHLFFNLLK